MFWLAVSLVYLFCSYLIIGLILHIARSTKYLWELEHALENDSTLVVVSITFWPLLLFFLTIHAGYLVVSHIVKEKN